MDEATKQRLAKLRQRQIDEADIILTPECRAYSEALMKWLHDPTPHNEVRRLVALDNLRASALRRT